MLKGFREIMTLAAAIITFRLAAAILIGCINSSPSDSGFDSTNSISNVDLGLSNKFAEIQLKNGSEFSGEVVGVYNHRPFIWNPSDQDTIAIVKLDAPEQDLDSFTNSANSFNAIFTLNMEDVASIKIVRPRKSSTTFKKYLRQQNVTLKHSTIQGEMFILTDWSSYHGWEDGYSNYAWDLSALNDNVMTYANLGNELTDYGVYNRSVFLPLSGTVKRILRSYPDNQPDLQAAIDFVSLDNGNNATLENITQNGIDVSPGGPFLLRVLHQKQNSVPDTIKIGQDLEAGQFIGQVGNSGTSYTPHIHLVFAFRENGDRYWSIPIEWQDYKRRKILYYPTGITLSSHDNIDFGYPKSNELISFQ